MEMGVVLEYKVSAVCIYILSFGKKWKINSYEFWSGGAPCYFVKGKDLKVFLTERYKLLEK